MKAKTT